MTLREVLQRTIRASTTQSTVALWAKSLLNAVLFFAIFMVALPWLAHELLPRALPIAGAVRIGLALPLAGVGIAAWITCLDSFSRRSEEHTSELRHMSESRMPSSA